MRTSVRVAETAAVGAVAETVSGPRSTRFSSVSSALRIWKLSLATPAKSFWKKFDDACCCDQRSLGPGRVPRGRGRGVELLQLVDRGQDGGVVPGGRLEQPEHVLLRAAPSLR